jgi:hypothetical protein
MLLPKIPGGTCFVVSQIFGARRFFATQNRGMGSEEAVNL